MAQRVKNREELLAEIEDPKAENSELTDTVEELQGQLDDISEIISPEEEEAEDEDGTGQD
jgi:hypothetical protein